MKSSTFAETVTPLQLMMIASHFAWQTVPRVTQKTVLVLAMMMTASRGGSLEMEIGVLDKPASCRSWCHGIKSALALCPGCHKIASLCDSNSTAWKPCCRAALAHKSACLGITNLCAAMSCLRTAQRLRLCLIQIPHTLYTSACLLAVAHADM